MTAVVMSPPPSASPRARAPAGPGIPSSGSPGRGSPAALGGHTASAARARAPRDSSSGIRVRRSRGGTRARSPPLVQVARVQLQVEPEAQTGVLVRERGRLDARWPVHEQARARQDSVVMRLDNAAVDAAARTEVVPVDDEPLHGPTSTAGWNTGRPLAARSAAA